MKARAVVAMTLWIAGCGQPQPEQNANFGTLVANGNESVPPPPAPQPVPPATGPDAKTPLAEPSSPIDPKSAEAAGQVVQHYGALIEQGRWTESWNLWSDPGAARQFDRNWRNDSEVHIEIGKPGNMEGAAGSSYVDVPLVFYGKDLRGGEFRKTATAVLRRVNDVPGSTEAQRRWHIERIDWQKG